MQVCSVQLGLGRTGCRGHEHVRKRELQFRELPGFNVSRHINSAVTHVQPIVTLINRAVHRHDKQGSRHFFFYVQARVHCSKRRLEPNFAWGTLNASTRHPLPPPAPLSLSRPPWLLRCETCCNHSPAPRRLDTSTPTSRSWVTARLREITASGNLKAGTKEKFTRFYELLDAFVERHRAARVLPDDDIGRDASAEEAVKLVIPSLQRSIQKNREKEFSRSA